VRRMLRQGGRLALGVAALALAAASFACGGGGGGGGGPTNPPPPPPISFTPGGAAGANSLALAQGAGTNSTTLVLELRASQVEGLYGVAFDLAYPGATLTYTRASEGSFLASAGAPTSFQVAQPTPGSLVVGLSRLGQQAGVSGSGVLLSLEFAAGANGSGALTFSRNLAYAADGTPQAGVAWTAGTVQVNR